MNEVNSFIIKHRGWKQAYTYLLKAKSQIRQIMLVLNSPDYQFQRIQTIMEESQPNTSNDQAPAIISSIKTVSQHRSSEKGSTKSPSGRKINLIEDSLHHITEPEPANAQEIVQRLIEEFIASVIRIIGVSSIAGELALRQTFQVLINDPNLGIVDASQNIKEHRKNHLTMDQEPKATATIDGSIGHVKVQEAMKKPLMPVGELSCPKSNKRWNKMSSINRYSSIIRKEPLQMRNLSSINEKVGPVSKGELDSHHKIKKRHQNIRNSEESQISNKKSETFSRSQPLKLVGCGNQIEYDDHYINYLRFVKVDINKNLVQIAEFGIRKQEEKRKSLLASLLGKQGQPILTESSEQTKKTIAGLTSYDGPFNDQIKPSRLVAKKKTNIFTYQNCVSVIEREPESISFSLKREQSMEMPKESRTKSKKATKVTKQKTQKQIQMGAEVSKGRKEKMKTVGDNKENIKLPILNLKRTSIKNAMPFYEGKEVWGAEEKQLSEHDTKFNDFFNSGSLLPSVNLRKAALKKTLHNIEQNQRSSDVPSTPKSKLHA